MLCTHLTGRIDDEGAAITHSREMPNHIAKVLVSQDVRHVLEKDVRRLQLFNETEEVLNEIIARITVKAFSLAQTAQTPNKGIRLRSCPHVFLADLAWSVLLHQRRSGPYPSAFALC